MDGAHKFKRFFPSYTLAELQSMLGTLDTSPNPGRYKRDLIVTAIAQRNPLDPRFVPHFVVPQVK